MNKSQLLNEILAYLYQVKESEDDLQKIHDFLFENIILDDEPELNIPEAYKAVVAEIADNLECGLICTVDRTTAAVISARSADVYGDGYLADEEDSETDMADNREDSITIKPLESSESFQIMESFVESLSEGSLKRSLTSAILKNKPFANFNAIIHNSPQKKEWFIFRKRAYEQHIAAILISESVW